MNTRNIPLICLIGIYASFLEPALATAQQTTSPSATGVQKSPAVAAPQTQPSGQAQTQSPAARKIASVSGKQRARLEAIIKFANPKNKKISKGIRFNSSRQRVVARRLGTKVQRFAIVRGTFNRPGWKLFHQGKELVPSPADNKFALAVPVSIRKTPFPLEAKGPQGETEKTDLALVLRSRRGLASIYGKSGFGPPRFAVLAAITSISYTETNAPDLSTLAVTPKVAIDLPLSKYFEVGVNGYYTVLTFNTLPSTAKAQFLGINGRFGWIPGFAKYPWRLALMAGAYFSSMTGSYVHSTGVGRSLGYTPVIVPQFYPTLRYAINQNMTASIYLKYVPLTLTSPFTDREIAAGGGLSYKRWIAGLDFSSFSMPTLDSSLRFGVFTMGFSLGATF